MVEQRHGRSPVLLRSRSAAAASRSAATSSLATGWSWLVMAWAMLPGLMNLTRMSASGGMEIGYRQQTANSRVRCPGIKKSGPCNATADFTDEPARDWSLTFTLHVFPQTKNAGRPFGARHRLHRPSPGRSQGHARMTLPAARHPTPRAARPRGEPSCRTSVQFGSSSAPAQAEMLPERRRAAGAAGRAPGDVLRLL
jgi:hypothetical protein